jgi:hypothetical protein
MRERAEFLAQWAVAKDEQVNPVTMTHYREGSQ